MIHALFALLVLLQPSYGTKGPREPSWEPVYLGDMVMGGKLERGAVSLGTPRNFAGYNLGRHLPLPKWLYLEAGAYSWFPGGLLVCCFVIPYPQSLIWHFFPTPYLKISLDLGTHVRVGAYWSWRMDEAVFLQIKVGRWFAWFHGRHSYLPSEATKRMMMNWMDESSEDSLGDIPYTIKSYPVQILEGGIMYAIPPSEKRTIWLRTRGVFYGYDNDDYNLAEVGGGYLWDEGRGENWDFEYVAVYLGYSTAWKGWKIDFSLTPFVVGRDEQGIYAPNKWKWLLSIIPATTYIINISGTYYF